MTGKIISAAERTAKTLDFIYSFFMHSTGGLVYRSDILKLSSDLKQKKEDLPNQSHINGKEIFLYF